MFFNVAEKIHVYSPLAVAPYAIAKINVFDQLIHAMGVPMRWIGHYKIKSPIIGQAGHRL